MLTGGHVHDIWGARKLLSSVTSPPRLIGDKAYDANDLRDYLATEGAEAVIPAKANRRRPIPYDPEAYRLRNVIERSFNRLKDWRGVATRYDKKGINFLAGVCLAASITYWIQ